MDDSFMKTFIEKYNRDKQEFHKRFEDLNKKLAGIDKKFDAFDTQMDKLDRRMSDIEELQGVLLGKLGFKDKLDNVRVYLSTIETKLNQFKTLNLEGEKVINGELYMLKIKLQNIKPIIKWENDALLSNKYKEIEESVCQLEQGAQY